jgi:hypothetical protein
MARRSQRRASCGKCSQIRMPSTFVAISRNGPRYSAAASDFMSHVSCCAGPPHMKSRMHRFARPNDRAPAPVADRGAASARAWSRPGRDVPSSARLPARTNSRRPAPPLFRNSAQPLPGVLTTGRTRGARAGFGSGSVPAGSDGHRGPDGHGRVSRVLEHKVALVDEELVGEPARRRDL